MLSATLLMTLTVANAGEPNLPPAFAGATSDSGKISSSFGPRDPGPQGGSFFHKGIDFNPGSGDTDEGALIRTFVEGTIERLSVPLASADGRVISIASSADTFLLRHLGKKGSSSSTPKEWGVPGPSLISSVVYTTQKAVQSLPIGFIGPPKAKVCPYIVFVSGQTGKGVHAYTSQACAAYKIDTGQTYAGVPAFSTVSSAYPWIATLGNTGTSYAHLHVELLSTCEGGTCNPLLRILHDRSPGDPPYSIGLTKPKLSKADSYLAVSIEFSPDADLESVSVKAAALGIAEKKWTFNGRKGTSAGRVTKAEMWRLNAPLCSAPETKPPLGVLPPPSVCVEPWGAEPNIETKPLSKKKLVFYAPVSLGNVAAGTYPVTVTAASVNRDYSPKNCWRK